MFQRTENRIWPNFAELLNHFLTWWSRLPIWYARKLFASKLPVKDHVNAVVCEKEWPPNLAGTVGYGGEFGSVFCIRRLCVLFGWMPYLVDYVAIKLAFIGSEYQSFSPLPSLAKYAYGYYDRHKQKKHMARSPPINLDVKRNMPNDVLRLWLPS